MQLIKHFVNESQMLVGCLQGESWAHKSLYESYLPYMLTIVRRYGFRQSEEPDVIQEIFIEIFSNLERFDGQKGRLKTWMRTLAVRKVLNIKRSRGRILFVDSEEGIPEVESFDISIFETSYILEAIQKLPEGYRTVFNMYEIDGYAHKEIAEMLHISVASSRSQLSRAKASLQKHLFNNHEVKSS